MLFKAATLSQIADGTATLAYRYWRRPTVRVGGTLRTSVGVLRIESIEPVQPEDITADDGSRAGFASRDALIDSLEPRSGGTLYRIAFHRQGDDPRDALREDDRLDPEERADLTNRLARLDRARPWTTAVLRLIAQRDGTTAGEIAVETGLDKPVVKRRIRQLKELGLTESLTSGYRLSPRGRALLPSLPII